MVLIKAKEATVYIASALSSPSSSTAFTSQITSIVDWSGKVRDISISGGEVDTEQVFLFGVDSDGRQNAETDTQPMSEREFSGTLILNTEDAAELSTSSGSSVGSTGFTRVQGDGTITPKCLLLKFVDSGTSAQLNVVLNNIRFLKMGDISLDAEGFATQEISGKCLAKDYYEEYKAGS